MNALARHIPATLPVFVRKALLRELLRATAAGFSCPVPGSDQRSYDERLRGYALFTREQAEKVLRSGADVHAVKTRLFREAFRLGVKLRRLLAIRTPLEAIEVGRILYRAIGIDLQGNADGDLTISRCIFSRYYSCQVCALISAMDDGLFSGLSGSGRLTFWQRLTEGGPCCRAKLTWAGESGG